MCCSGPILIPGNNKHVNSMRFLFLSLTFVGQIGEQINIEKLLTAYNFNCNLKKMMICEKYYAEIIFNRFRKYPDP